jgi:hypothetical protein
MQERDRFIWAELKANSMIWYSKSIWQFGLANSIPFGNSTMSAIEFGNSVW